MRQGKRRNRHGDRISPLVRESRKSDFTREAEDRIKSFVAERPLLSTCLGLGAGFVLGALFRRRD